MKRKLFLSILVFVLFTWSIYAQETVGMSEATVCCEKTNSGLYCQDVKAGDCASERQPPTACESTSFCKSGWCYDSSQGTCLDNVAQKVCTDSGGTWNAEKPAVCNLGCCVLDDQASFVTLVRCKKLSGFYGLETNWDSSITNEAVCLLTAGTKEKGACVFTKDFEKTCKFTTKETCTAENVLNNGGSTIGTNTNLGLEDSGLTPADNENAEENSETDEETSTTTMILPFVRAEEENPVTAETESTEVTFYPGKLCTAEELGTNCGLTRNTICVSGKEEVYFVDTCGNPANIYDASKVNDRDYWADIIEKDESCGAGSNNKNSQACGNCNYLLGTYCREATGTNPTYGKNICQNLNCIDKNGRERIHGESWCFYDGGNDGKPGSKYYRQLCRNGEIKVESCADFRQEECIESSEGGFSQAACRVNRWQDCTAQKKREDCENSDKRDCKWLDGFEYVLFGSIMNGTTFDANSLGSIAEGVKQAGGLKNIPKGACVPEIPPGLNFWTSDEASGVCAQANAICPVTYEKGLVGGDWECIEHCECLPGGELERKRVQLCTSLGDCGPKVNFVGQQGSGKGYEIKEMEQDDEE